MLLFVMIFVAMTFLVGSQGLAVKPACQEVQIFRNEIKIEWTAGCEELVNVYFKDSNYPGGWRPGVEITLTMCTCEGNDCVDNLDTNIAREGQMCNGEPCDVTVECFPVRDSGPKLGIPIFLNPPRSCVGSRCFR